MSGATGPLTIEQVPINQLRHDPTNPRRISDEELESLERSLRQFGFVQPVLARKQDRVVIGGHQRLVAARRLGLTTVPVIWLDVSVNQARLLNLALNKISGSWDEQLLARLLADLQASPEVDLSLSGFGDDEVRDLLCYGWTSYSRPATRAPRSRPATSTGTPRSFPRLPPRSRSSCGAARRSPSRQCAWPNSMASRQPLRLMPKPSRGGRWNSWPISLSQPSRRLSTRLARAGRALEIAAGWVRTKLASKAIAIPESATQ